MSGQNRTVWLAFGGVALIGIVVCGGGILGLRRLIGTGAGSLPQIQKEAVRLDIPLEVSAYDPDPIPKESENAAKVYEAAFSAYDALLKSHPGAEEAVRRVGADDESVQQRRLAEAFVRDSSRVLALAARASSMPSCYFPHDWTTASAATPEYSEIRRICILSRSRARLQAESGDVSEAYRSLLVCARIARQFSTMPEFMADLSAITYADIAIKTAGEILMAHPNDRAAISGAQAVLEATGDPPGIRRGLVMETPSVLVILRSIRRWSDIAVAIGARDASKDMRGFDGARLVGPAFRSGLQAKYLEALVGLVSHCPKDDEDYKGFEQAIDSANEAAGRDRSLTGQVASVFLPMSSWPKIVASARARRHVLAASIKLLSLRVAGKPLPDELPDFGKISIDPMDGARLKYERVGTGFEIWAIGRDGVDHGGVMRPTPSAAGVKYDEALVFP